MLNDEKRKRTEKTEITSIQKNKITIKNISCIIKYEINRQSIRDKRKKSAIQKRKEKKTVLLLSNIFIPNKRKNNNRLLF